MTKLLKIRFLQLLALAMAATFLLGAGDSPETRVNKLGHEMMCMCGCNQILAECNHVGCSYSSRMMGEIREAVARGDSDGSIRNMMVEKYGTTVLAAPTTSGFNLVAWIMPFVTFALALAAVVFVIRTWKRRAALAPASAPPVSTDILNSYRDRARKDTEL